MIRKCSMCKNEFNKDDLIYYTSLKSKTGAWYCADCFREKQNRELFSNTVCEIFGLKSPGPILWKGRKSLIDKGYTDAIIIDCLKYIYNVKHCKKLSESLVLVKPDMINEMLEWKKNNENKANNIITAVTNNNKNIKTTIASIKNNQVEKEFLNIDDFLDEN